MAVSRGRRMRQVGVAAAAATGLALAGLGGTARGAGTTSWITTGSNMSKVAAVDPALATRLFDSAAAYATGNRQGTQDQVPSGYDSQATLPYRSYAALAADLKARAIDPRITVLLYDPENWSDTPLVERQHPLTYMKQFVSLAHAHGYRAVLAPGRDLMGVKGADCSQSRGETYAAAYLRCKLASVAADGFEIQAQADEFSPVAYASFVRAAAAQAFAADPRAAVFAGLSTSPATGTATATQLSAAAAAVRGSVTGYYLTIQAADPAQLQTAIDFLRLQP